MIKEVSLELAITMAKKYHADILYLNILAEAYAKNQRWSEAVELFDHVVATDKLNQRLRSTTEITHRAFCTDCLRPFEEFVRNANCRHVQFTTNAPSV
jgi:pentatricopeptide repeat protein